MNVLQNVILGEGRTRRLFDMLRKFVTTLGRNIITVRLIGRGLIQLADGNVESRTMPQSFSDCEISNIKHNLLQQSVAFLKSV